MTKVDYYPFLHLQKMFPETSLHNLTRGGQTGFFHFQVHTCTHMHTLQKEKGREETLLDIEIIFPKAFGTLTLQLGMCPAAESWLLILERTGENLTC